MTFPEATINHRNPNKRMPPGAFIATLLPGLVGAASLEPATLGAWEEYVKATNTRMEERLHQAKSFLWVDESFDRLTQVRNGEISVSPVGLQNPRRVPSGLIHDWIGAVFIPNVSIKD